MDTGDGHVHAHGQHQPGADTTDTGSGDHASHCHEGMAQCAGQSSFVGTWWIGDSGEQLTLNAALQLIDESYVLLATLEAGNPIPHPPQVAV